MSVSRGCEIIELNPGKWYAVVANREYDYTFQHGHTVYGPAHSEEVAWTLMSSQEPNPGGGKTIPHEQMSDRERALIATGHKR